MAKIDFLKVEVELSKAVHTIFVKDIMAQKPTLSKAFIEFFRLDDAPRPIPIDPVILGLEELIKESKEEKQRLAILQDKADRKRELIAAGKTEAETTAIIEQEVMEELEKTRRQSVYETPPPTSVTLPEKIPTKEDEEKPLPPIFLLRKHIHWMRRKKAENLYTNLGCTEEEYKTLEKKGTLTSEEEARVVEILEKAKIYRQKLIEKLGLQNDEKVIEEQRKKQITKRFNIKETWLPLQ